MTRLHVNAAALGAALVLVLFALLEPKPARRDPLFAVLVKSYWVLYLGIAVAIAMRASVLPPTGLLALHAGNAAIAVLVAVVVGRASSHVDAAADQRQADRLGMQELVSAATRLKLEAATWPAAPQQAAIDATIASMMDVIRFAPSRVPPELEQHVTEAIAMVESTGEKTRGANGQPPEWYLGELQLCGEFVSARMDHVQTHLSERRS